MAATATASLVFVLVVAPFVNAVSTSPSAKRPPLRLVTDGAAVNGLRGSSIRDADSEALALLDGVSTFCPREVKLWVGQQKCQHPQERFTDLFRERDRSAALVPPALQLKNWPLNWKQMTGWKVTALDQEHGVFHVQDFLTTEEADRMVHHYAPMLLEGAAHAHSQVDASSCTARRSSTIWTPGAPTSVQKKMEQLTGIARDHFEPLSVTRYDKGGFFSDHYDSLGGDGREITVLLHLNDAQGGATYFPDLNLRSPPRKGSALVFFPTIPGSTTANGWMRHCGEDALSEKWVAQQWVRRTVVPPRNRGLPGVAWFHDGSSLMDN
eukprot:gnl/TRDRNA2_/TRDRNA2_188112_c0_seq1.p1 gnl/TRDRNA2_/TRDRNA2_188112_c0~~gnl/TRDRNA2_/TRDRNA2_188112_c0_seq1.p1  ORF type:complete len:343 (-),score=64.38 gnl/TRDRNA2_/TRDRNA2_188112_c0_seq1:93-1064(-)